MRSHAPAGRRIAGVALIASLAALAAACSSNSGSSSSTPAGTPTTSSSSASPTATPTTASPTGSPSTTAGTTACATSQLHVYTNNSNGAAGTIYYDLIFTNTSATACTLSGYPGVSFVTAASDSGSQVGSDAKRNSVYPVATITVAPGARAHALLGIAEAGNFPASDCNPVNTHYMKVFPPGETVAAYFSFATQTCASTSTPTMHISAIVSGS